MAKQRVSLTLSDEARAWMEPVSNASAYVDAVLKDSAERVRVAELRLSRWTRPMILAAMEVLDADWLALNPTPAARFRDGLLQMPEIQERWSLTDAQWAELGQINDAQADSIRTLALERKLGRIVP